MKKQILIIHGGNPFDKYQDYLNYLKKYKIKNLKILKKKTWARSLKNNLDDKYEVIQPEMPCKKNAKYKEWKIWVEKFIPFLKEEVILVGYSLGGIFWLKYLSENKFPVFIKQLHLVSTPITDKRGTLGDFYLKKNLNQVSKQVEKIFLYQSKDDKIVSFSDFKKLTKKFPNAQKVIFQNKGHFNQPRLKELEDKIKNNL